MARGRRSQREQGSRKPQSLAESIRRRDRALGPAVPPTTWSPPVTGIPAGPYSGRSCRALRSPGRRAAPDREHGARAGNNVVRRYRHRSRRGKGRPKRTRWSKRTCNGCRRKPPRQLRGERRCAARKTSSLYWWPPATSESPVRSIERCQPLVRFNAHKKNQPGQRRMPRDISSSRPTGTSPITQTH